MEILLHGTEPYTKNRRYSGIHNAEEDVWILKIEDARKDDEGKYECQMNSLPVKSHIISLQVLSTRVDIIGDEDLYVQIGSSIILTCVVENVSSEDEMMISWSKEGMRIKVETLKHNPRSELTLDNVMSHSEGVYECEVASIDRAHIFLHVLDKDRTELLQTSAVDMNAFVKIYIVVSCVTSCGWIWFANKSLFCSS